LNRRRFLYRVAGLAVGMLMPGPLVRASANTLQGERSLSLPAVQDTAIADSNTIYLTFDDGYIGIAEKVAAINALGVPGTFFLTGQGVAAHPGDVQWLVNSGHVLGNHTYDHVNVRASRLEDIQFRFRRAPWLIAGQAPRSFARHPAGNLSPRRVTWRGRQRTPSRTGRCRERVGLQFALARTQAHGPGPRGSTRIQPRADPRRGEGSAARPPGTTPAASRTACSGSATPHSTRPPGARRRTADRRRGAPSRCPTSRSAAC